MPTFVPPPEQRFDPITARRLTPGGPLFDPDRTAMDDGDLPVTLVGPVPRELRHISGHAGTSVNPYARMRRVVFGLIGVVAVVMFGLSAVGLFG